MAEGWICLHRKMLDNGTVCRDAAHMAIWVYLLLSAEHEETEVLFGGERRVLKAGELMISVNKFAETYGIEIKHGAFSNGLKPKNKSQYVPTNNRQ